MAATEEKARRPFPTQPLWLIVLSPLLTVPLTQSATQSLIQSDSCTIIGLDFIGGSASCETAALAVALAPGLVNLAPFLWLFARDARTRTAALVAGFLGAARFVVPLATLLASGPTSNVSWGFYQAFPNDQSLVGVSIFLWALSVATLIVVGVRGLRRRGRQNDQRSAS
jgi:hypothetical protein